MNSSSQRLI